MKIFKKIGAARNRLTHIGKDDPLNFLSIVVILALDVFVLWNIFQGVAFQTSQLTSATEAVPYSCQELAGIGRYSDTSRWDSLNRVLEVYYFNGQSHKELIADCGSLIASAQTLKNSTTVKELYSQLETANDTIKRLRRENQDYNRSYDTLLLEKIADQNDEFSITESKADQVRSDIETNQTGIMQSEARVEKLKTEILNTAAAQTFLEIRNSKSQAIEAEFDRLKFWYPVKKLVFRLIFLVPLLLVFFVLYCHSVKREKPLLTLIFSHLLVVTCIPIVIEILDLFFELLPFHLLTDLLNWLKDLGLVALWNYFLILFGIVAALGLIYVVQKKLFSRERQMHKRIAKGQCCYCGVKLGKDDQYCFKCGKQNLKKCAHTGELTYVEGKYSRACGKRDF